MREEDVSFWQKRGSGAISKWAENIEMWKGQRRNFWAHLTLVNSTVLGFTVGVTQLTGAAESSIFLILSWGFLIFSIILGLILMKEDQDIKFKTDFDNFRFQYNMAEIFKKDAMGEISREEKLGLILATMADNQTMNLRKENYRFSQKAKAIIQKFEDKLPTAEFLEPIPGKNRQWDNPVKLWILKNHLNLANLLYFLTTLAFLFLFLSVMFRSP